MLPVAYLDGSSMILV